MLPYVVMQRDYNALKMCERSNNSHLFSRLRVLSSLKGEHNFFASSVLSPLFPAFRSPYTLDSPIDRVDVIASQNNATANEIQLNS